MSDCNLKIKKLFPKILLSASLLKSSSKLNNLFKIQLSEEHSKIIFIENSSLKYVQDFKFGSNLIIKDISKVTD